MLSKVLPKVQLNPRREANGTEVIFLKNSGSIFLKSDQIHELTDSRSLSHP